MASKAKMRLIHDLHHLQKENNPNFIACVNEDNILEWKALLYGPSNSVHQNGAYLISFTFTEDFPNKAPHVKFLTKMYHPNIYNNGEICLDILQNRWSSIYNISTILLSIQSLLEEPNTSSPANLEAAKNFEKNLNEYEMNVKETVVESWVNKEMIDFIAGL
eukprot:GAHX01001510.1.p1 GENE.GAHX01001510.1~~GAHX01001510.1.p1  ORF type:complete len:162 (+),score=30.90 GAHX01001510.1:44-529(+)